MLEIQPTTKLVGSQLALHDTNVQCCASVRVSTRGDRPPTPPRRLTWSGKNRILGAGQERRLLFPPLCSCI